jgi:hypothetical protein
VRAKTHWPPLRALATLLAVGTPCSTAFAGSCDATGSMAPPDVPAPEYLEGQGARVGAIHIEVEDIFDPDKPGESALPYRLATSCTRAPGPR